MISAPNIEANAEPAFVRAHSYILTFLVCTLCVTTLLKIGDVQYLELILAADLPIVMWLFARNGFEVRVFRPFASIATSYAIFLIAAFLLSIVALQQTFNPALETFLKRPLVVTLSRMAELLLDAFYMLYLASLFRENENLCRFGARVYYWTGIAGAIYSVVGFPLDAFFGIQDGVYGASFRMRGFANEGGPYGIYVISVCALAVAMYHREWLTRRQFVWGFCLLFVCLVGSQSKAAFLEIPVVGLLYLIWALKGAKRWMILLALAVAISLAGAELDIPGKLRIYERAIAMYQQESNVRTNDANFVMGRVSGAVLAPRMIKAHPWTGVGWGNYPLVRDDPEYRQGSAFAMGPMDSPSLGVIDYIVELGFPLWLYLTWTLLKPAYLLRRHRSDPWVMVLAAMLPVTNWFGAHLNLVYPWAVAAIALGMGFGRRNDAVETESLQRPIAGLSRPVEA
jgi:O-antigen ligase